MKLLNPAVARVLKRLHYPLDVMLMCVRWYVAYGLSVRNLEEMMAERGIQVDHSNVHRWAMKLLPVLEKAFRHHKRPVGRSGRVDETYIKLKRRTRPMLGFKTFRCARILLGSIELMHMIVKGQMQNSSSGQTHAEQFYSLAK